MPFTRKGTAALTERLDIRVAPEEKEQPEPGFICEQPQIFHD